MSQGNSLQLCLHCAENYIWMFFEKCSFFFVEGWRWFKRSSFVAEQWRCEMQNNDERIRWFSVNLIAHLEFELISFAFEKLWERKVILTVWGLCPCLLSSSDVQYCALPFRSSAFTATWHRRSCSTCPSTSTSSSWASASSSSCSASCSAATCPGMNWHVVRHCLLHELSVKAVILNDQKPTSNISDDQKGGQTFGRTGRGRTVLNFSSFSGGFCGLNQEQTLTRVCSWSRAKNEVPVFHMNAWLRVGGSAMMHGEVQMFTTAWRSLNSRTADSMVAAESVSVKRHVHLWKTETGLLGCGNFHDSKWQQIRRSLCFADTDNKERERNTVIMR